MSSLDLTSDKEQNNIKLALDFLRCEVELSWARLGWRTSARDEKYRQEQRNSQGIAKKLCANNGVDWPGYLDILFNAEPSIGLYKSSLEAKLGAIDHDKAGVLSVVDRATYWDSFSKLPDDVLSTFAKVAAERGALQSQIKRIENLPVTCGLAAVAAVVGFGALYYVSDVNAAPIDDGVDETLQIEAAGTAHSVQVPANVEVPDDMALKYDIG